MRLGITRCKHLGDSPISFTRFLSTHVEFLCVRNHGKWALKTTRSLPESKFLCVLASSRVELDHEGRAKLVSDHGGRAKLVSDHGSRADPVLVGSGQDELNFLDFHLVLCCTARNAVISTPLALIALE